MTDKDEQPKRKKSDLKLLLCSPSVHAAMILSAAQLETSARDLTDTACMEFMSRRGLPEKEDQ